MTSPRLSTFAHEIMGDAHAHLEATDECYFIWEYTRGQRYDYSEANQLITNLKIRPSEIRANPQRARYKQAAINKCAQVIADNIVNVDGVVFVPVPSSRVSTDPDYDDRMAAILRRVNEIKRIDARELVVQTANTRRSREAGADRLRQSELLDVWQIDESLTDPPPHTIVVVDDMLTAGTHFKAMQRLLQQRFPDAKVDGLFITRRIFANTDETQDF